MTAAIELREASRSFGTVVALDRVSLSIASGEFFAVLGPSGSGKTTCLRLIAGFDRPTSGRVELHGRDVTDLPPYERDVNTVFQDYALFPHMTVGENIAYGLMIKKVPQLKPMAKLVKWANAHFDEVMDSQRRFDAASASMRKQSADPLGDGDGERP